MWRRKSEERERAKSDNLQRLEVKKLRIKEQRCGELVRRQRER